MSDIDSTNDRTPLLVDDGTRHAVVDGEGLVLNVIIAPDDFDPGRGCSLVAVADDSPVEPGDQLLDGQLTKAEHPDPGPTLEERVAELERKANA